MPPTSLRDIVLAAAVDYIDEHGPDGLSFRQVAAAAGVSHQAPYHHFTDRKGIFQAIALEGFSKFAQALRDSQPRPGENLSVVMLENYVEFALAHKGHFRVMFRSDLACADERPDVRAVADEAFDVLVDHVERMLGPGASVDEIRTRATAMWALAHGLATLLIDGPLEATIGQVSDRRALIRAVAMQTGLGTR